jgi:putative FmdB family regulatory protein
MPKYDYKCNTCGGEQEIERSIGDSTEPICCQTTMSRVWSAVAVKFNGTGFYSTGG